MFVHISLILPTDGRIGKLNTVQLNETYLRKWVDGTSVVSSLVGNSVVLGFVGMIYNYSLLTFVIL